MPYYGPGSDDRPPLPPRPHPEPGPVLGQTYASKYGTAQSRTPAQEDVPPPIPQRPPGYHVRPSPSQSPSPAPVSPMTPPPAGFASPFGYPPPPPSPNRYGRLATPPLPPRPVSAQSHLHPGAYAGSWSGSGASSRPQSSQGGEDPQNPYGWTKFPPPPPGPPPRPSAASSTNPPAASSFSSAARPQPTSGPTAPDGRPVGSQQASALPTKDPEFPSVSASAHMPAPAPAQPSYVVSPLPPSTTPTFHPSPLSSYTAPALSTSYFPQSPPPAPHYPPKPTVQEEDEIDELLHELELQGGSKQASATGAPSPSPSVHELPSSSDASASAAKGGFGISELEDPTSAAPHASMSSTQSPPQRPSRNPQRSYEDTVTQSFTAELPGDLPHSATALRNAPQPPMVPGCIDTAATFETTWYTHPSAPEFPICAYCYTQHILPSPFGESFRGTLLSDGKARQCRFSKPRMRAHLFETAIASGHLQPVLNWMRLRASIQDCRGTAPIRGDAGYKWFRPRHGGDIPGFVMCHACHEDHALTNSLSAFFEPTHLQGANEYWACDMAVPYIRSEYNEKGMLKTDNAWASFAAEAKGRMSIAPCPGRKFSKSHGKRWFTPNEGVGPKDLQICHACFCDHIAIFKKDLAPQWREDTELTRRFTNEVRCSVGSKYYVRTSLVRCEDSGDFAPFWRAMNMVSDGAEKVCDEKGIVGGIWYTFPSDPLGFRVCRACFVAIGQAYSITQFFVPKHHEESAGDGNPRLCCLNPAHPRFKNFVPRLLEMYFTRSRTGLEKYAATFASVPPCPRENEVRGRSWFGWRDCTICPECHRDFTVQHGGLAAQMEFDGTAVLPEATICDMYSPRMRNLYKDCAASGDAGPLRTFAARRRLVYLETVPRMKQMIQEQRLRASQQGLLNAPSTSHDSATDQRQGVGTASDASAALEIVRELERRWKQVE